MAERGLSHSELFETTTSAIPVQSTYTANDLTESGFDASRDLGEPGSFPFTRGINATGYRSKLWVMGQYSGYASPKQTNERIRSLIASGQRGFSVALDLPTQNGLDSDDALSVGEVGKVGVPISSLLDMEEILDGIPLNQVSQVRTTANSIAPVMLAFFVVAAKRHGYSTDDFKVMFQNDSLKEYVARGTQIFGPRRAMEFSVDVIEYCARNMPHWEPIEFCGYHIRDSGADAIQETAIAAANGMEYIAAAQRRGLDVDDFAENLFMFLSADVEIFEEVAKFRAIRRVWATIMRDQFGALRPESQALNIFVYTLGGSLTAQEPLNNISRVAYQALAAVLGGVQTLATSSYDEALGIPTAAAAKTSLRAQQIIAYETGIAKTADPLGGSYYLESLTTEFESRIRAYLARIDDQGGALAALESGWLAAEIGEAAYQQQLAIETGTKVRVAQNILVDESVDAEVSTFTVDPETENEQIERLKQLRSERDNDRTQRALSDIQRAAAQRINTIPAIMEAVESYATIGEIIGTLKGEWGTYRNPIDV
jgi:methylmalonyl-CoA mutase N-terminal domain/subunit